MVSKTYIELAGSAREAPTGATRLGPVSADERIEVSVYLKPREASGPKAPALLRHPAPLDRSPAPSFEPWLLTIFIPDVLCARM